MSSNRGCIWKQNILCKVFLNNYVASLNKFCFVNGSMYKILWSHGHHILVTALWSCTVLLATTETFSLVGRTLLLTRTILVCVPYLLLQDVPHSVKSSMCMTSLPVLRCMVCYFKYFKNTVKLGYNELHRTAYFVQYSCYS